MKYYLTKEHFLKLQEDLNRLKTETRAEVSERLKRAKEYGDLSENSEYIDAKEDQAKLESHIIELENVIRNAILIKKANDKDIVNIGSTIAVEKDGRHFSYTIVGSEEARPEVNLISNESPLGQAFLGKKIGDIIKVQAPKGMTTYKIIKIE